MFTTEKKHILLAVMVTGLIVGSLFTSATLLYTSRLQSKPDSVNIMKGGTVSVGALPCSYMDFITSGTIYMQQCTGSRILFSSTNASAVISDSIGNLTSGGVLFVKAGTYTISQQINVLVSGVTISGEGYGTILEAGTNMVDTTGYDGGSIAVVAVDATGQSYTNTLSHVTVENLQIDGNRANQAGACLSPTCTGLQIWGGSYDTIQNVYVHDAKTFCLYMNDLSYSTVTSSAFVNCQANGISLWTAGSPISAWDTIINNQIMNASDVGATLYAMNSQFTYNVVQNVNWSNSPFGINSHYGIMVGDVGNATGVEVSRNFVYQATSWAIISASGGPTTPNANILIDDDHILDCGGGVETQDTHRVTISNPMIQSTLADAGISLSKGTTYPTVIGGTINDTASNGIYVNGVSRALITGIAILMTGRAMGNSAIALFSSPNDTVSASTFDVTADAGDTAISLSSSPYVSLIGNTIRGSPSSKAGDGIDLNSPYDVIEGNTIGGFNVCINGGYGAAIGDGIVGNVFSKTSCVTAMYLGSQPERVENNVGYNPVGYLAAPISGTVIVDIGYGSSTWVSGTTYTNWQSPKTLYISGGTVTAIVVDGQTLYTSATTCTVKLEPGDTFSVTFSSAPTIKVFGQ